MRRPSQQGWVRRAGAGAVASLVAAGMAGPGAAALAAHATAAGPVAPPAAPPCAAAPGVQVREAGRYVVTVRIGPVPRMYTAAEAARQKPRTGVVMLEPMKPIAGGGMMAGAGRRHLRVQVCDRASGKALRSPRPVVEVTAGMARLTVPVSLGYDVGSPPADVRFCQVLPLGDGSVGVAVTVGRQTVAFAVAPGA